NRPRRRRRHRNPHATDPGDDHRHQRARAPHRKGHARVKKRDEKFYESRAHRRTRFRRHGRRAYIRSVYFLPSMATLGNAICGFGAMYVAAFDRVNVGNDPWAIWLLAHKFVAAAYLIFVAMVFDALDGRLARFT